MAQPFHHTILALARGRSANRDPLGPARFRAPLRRRAIGMWLPESAVDLATLRLLAEHGVEHTILAPWQAAGHHIETRRPYRVELGGGRSIVVALYDSGLSGAISFEPGATADADRYSRDRLAPRCAEPQPDDEPPVVVIATDGELYGHHQAFRELFLHRLVTPRPDGTADQFEVTSLAKVLREDPARPFRTTSIRDGTSWSCHHGILRWTGPCPCSRDATWKAPLRAALERLAAGIDSMTERLSGGLPGAPDPWAARDDYVMSSSARRPARSPTAGCPAAPPPTGARPDGGERWRLAAFASDAWYWDDPPARRR
jgi:hypothetical protein